MVAAPLCCCCCWWPCLAAFWPLSVCCCTTLRPAEFETFNVGPGYNLFSPELGTCGLFFSFITWEKLYFYNFLSFYKKQVVLVVLAQKKATFRAGHLQFFVLKTTFLTENIASGPSARSTVFTSGTSWVQPKKSQEPAWGRRCSGRAPCVASAAACSEIWTPLNGFTCPVPLNHVTISGWVISFNSFLAHHQVGSRNHKI